MRRISTVVVLLLAGLLIAGLITRNAVLADASSATEPGAFDSDYIYRQIVEHKLPLQPDGLDHLPVYKDGSPTYFPLGLGRYYTGPNGLEIRFTHKGTQAATEINALIASAGLGTAIVGGARGTVLLSDVVMSSLSSVKLKSAAFGVYSTAEVLGIFDEFYKTLIKTDCIGVTIPNRDTLNQILTRVDALAQLGVLLKLTKDPDLNDIWRANLAVQALPYANIADMRVWFEPCAPDDKLSDIVATPPPPVADTQPVVKAEPIPAPVERAQPTQVSSPPAPVHVSPPPAPEPNRAVNKPDDVCWLSGSDYRTFVKPWDHSYVWFYARQFNSIDQIQVPTPKWMHWTQNVGGEWRLEGQYKDSSGQDMWSEGDFFAADFWTSVDQADQASELAAYNQLKDGWGHTMYLVNNAPQC